MIYKIFDRSSPTIAHRPDGRRKGRAFEQALLARGQACSDRALGAQMMEGV